MTALIRDEGRKLDCQDQMTRCTDQITPPRVLMVPRSASFSSMFHFIVSLAKVYLILSCSVVFCTKSPRRAILGQIFWGGQLTIASWPSPFVFFGEHLIIFFGEPLSI